MQRERVLARPGMTVDKLEHLLARQLPDAERRERADYVVDSGTSLKDMHAALDKLIESLKQSRGRVMDAAACGQAASKFMSSPGEERVIQ